MNILIYHPIYLFVKYIYSNPSFFVTIINKNPHCSIFFVSKQISGKKLKTTVMLQRTISSSRVIAELSIVRTISLQSYSVQVSSGISGDLKIQSQSLTFSFIRDTALFW